MALISYGARYFRLSSHINNFIRSSSTKGCPKKGLVLGVYTSENKDEVLLTKAASKYNTSTGGKLLEQIKLAGNEVKEAKSFIFWGLDDKYRAVAVTGLGKKSQDIEKTELLNRESEAVRVAASTGCRALDAVGIKDIDVEDFSHGVAAAEGSILGTWIFQEYKTKKKELPKIHLFDQCTDNKKWKRGIIRAESQNLARKLEDTPSNLLTPSIYADFVVNLLTPLGVEVKVYDKKWAEEQKMGAFLAVSQGSKQPPKFLELTYRKSEQKNPYVFVGKGVTFDTGGISLKPALSMDEMRADLGGSACVIGTLYALAKLNLPVNVKALIPLTENMPSGAAIKPGDVVTARNGKTICIDNTDAEGRLILADALSYSAEFKPKWVVDLATLTGAMRIALGNGASGVFSNSDDLYKKLEDAGCTTGDRVWRMPLWKHYNKTLLENAAYDVNNIGKAKGGGSCSAAAFLREFVPANTDWMHIDIAGVVGPDTSPYLQKGMTGRPTRTLIEFLEKQCQS